MISDEQEVQCLNQTIGSPPSSPVLLTKSGPHEQLIWHKLTQSNHCCIPVNSLRLGQTCHTPNSSNLSLYLIKLSNSSYPGGNFEGNHNASHFPVLDTQSPSKKLPSYSQLRVTILQVKVSFVNGINRTNHSTNQGRPCTTTHSIKKKLSFCQSHLCQDPVSFPQQTLTCPKFEPTVR